MKKLALIFSTIALVCLSTAGPAFAARIYNFLPVGVYVRGIAHGETTHLAPGQQSASLSWPYTTGVDILKENRAAWGANIICDVGFNSHAEIQGGNYMTIGHVGSSIKCAVCNASHELIVGRSHKVDGLFDVTKYPNSRTGC